MIESFNSMEKLESELTQRIVTTLKKAVEDKNKAKLLLSGGNTPKGVYTKLSHTDIEWEKVHIGLVDERFVSNNSEFSNEKMIREVLIQNKAVKAKLTGMVFESDYIKNVEAARLKYQDFRDSDLVILGMGNDGHTASIFPNDNLSEKACSNTPPTLINTNAPEHPTRRITLNKTFICEANEVILMITGNKKGLVFENSVQQNYPIRHFIHKINSVYYTNNQ
jgi:6-phosphogluconolactonase